MKSIKLIPIAIAISFFGLTACYKHNSSNEKQLNESPQTLSDFLGEKIQKDFAGTVIDEAKKPIANVSITIGNITTQTDSNGSFVINGANVNSDFAYLETYKEGYKNTSISIGDSSKLSIILPKVEAQCLFWFCKHNHSLPNSNH